MCPVIDLLKPFLGDMRVDLSCRKACMPQEFLDNAQIRSPVEEVRGIGVAKSVGMRGPK